MQLIAMRARNNVNSMPHNHNTITVWFIDVIYEINLIKLNASGHKVCRKQLNEFNESSCDIIVELCIR